MNLNDLSKISDDISCDTLDANLIKQNQLQLDIFNNYKNRDLQQTIQNLLQIKQNDNSQKIQILTSIGVCYFQLTDYTQAQQYFENAFEILENNQQVPDAIKIRLLGNLLILYLVFQNQENIQYIIEILTDLVIKSKDRYELVQLLINQLYKFQNFDKLFENIQLENVEDYWYPLGCIYSSLALTKQFQNDFQTALNYHQKALQTWIQLEEPSFQLLTLKHLQYLQPKQKEYQQMINHLQENQQLQGINFAYLFKDFEKKISMAQMITQTIQQLHVQRQSQNENFHLAKQALLLQIQLTINSTKDVASDKNNFQTNQNIEQLKQIKEIILQENNQIVLQQIYQLKFTKQAIDHLKAQVNKIRKLFINLLYGDAFYKIKTFTLNKLVKKSALKSKPKKKQQQNDKQLLDGEYVIKCNKDTNGRLRKFFKIDDQHLLWATKHTSSQFTEFPLKNINGLLYGKCSSTFTKQFNNGLEPWLCFSLVLQNRTLDILCNENQINAWYLVLAKYIKNLNKNAYVLTIGKFFWRKMQLIVQDKAQKYYKKMKYQQQKLSFCKCIILAKRISIQENKHDLL